MKNIRLLIENVYDTAELSLTTGSEAGAMVLANTQQYGNELRFVSTDISAVVIAGNFSLAKLISGFILHRHNLSNTAKIRLEIFDDRDQTGKLVYDSGLFNAVPQTVYNDWDWRIQPIVSSPFDHWSLRFSQMWFAEVFGLSFRLTINDPDNTAGEIELTRAYMGRTFEPRVNFAWGQKSQLLSGSKQVRTDGGSIYSKMSKKYRRVDVALHHINSSERPHLFNALNYVGTEKDFFVSLYPEQGDQQELESAFAGKFTDTPPLTHAGFNRTQSALTIEEC